MIIAYLAPTNGHEGKKYTFSEKAAEIAAEKIDAGAALLPMDTLDDVAASLAGGDADLAVMASFNSLSGIVPGCLELIELYKFRIIDVQRLPIVLSIGAYPRSSDAGKVYSHPIALAQCSRYLAEHYPCARKVPVDSTAAGAAMARREMSGLAIAHADALRGNGLEVTASDIGNLKSGKNFTDFFLVAQTESQIKQEMELME